MRLSEALGGRHAGAGVGAGPGAGAGGGNAIEARESEAGYDHGLEQLH